MRILFRKDYEEKCDLRCIKRYVIIDGYREFDTPIGVTKHTLGFMPTVHRYQDCGEEARVNYLKGQHFKEIETIDFILLENLKQDLTEVLEKMISKCERRKIKEDIGSKTKYYAHELEIVIDKLKILIESL